MNNINKELNINKKGCPIHPIRCSRNQEGVHGECSYLKKCGVIAFYCRH